uniref:MADS-box domain-containing protein n=1 Tax=Oryza punctata TaxID=4537 RepID=A0A0E0KBE2_ORYPU
MVKCRARMTRKKIEIKRGDKKVRDACFSKRHTTIFNKANELAILCGVMVAAAFVSPNANGGIFSFGYPSVSSVANRFLANHAPNSTSVSSSTQSGRDVEIRELEREERELKEHLQASKNKNKLLQKAIAARDGGQLMLHLQSDCSELGPKGLVGFGNLLMKSLVIYYVHGDLTYPIFKPMMHAGEAESRSELKMAYAKR